jgi:hypothetical protein
MNRVFLATALSSALLISTAQAAFASAWLFMMYHQATPTSSACHIGQRFSIDFN